MRLPRALQAPVGYLLAAVLFTWPLVLHPAGLLASVQGPGDSYLNLWILGWNVSTLASDPGALFSGQIFNANIFHPATGTLAFSDHFLLQSIVLLPLYVVTHNVVLCYNVLFFGSLVAAAWAMHITVRELSGSEIAAWTAGLAWGFAPYHFGHFIHIQLQALYFLPLAFLFLHRTMASGRTRDACLLGVTAALSAIGSVYYGVIGSIGLAVAAVAWLLLKTDRTQRLRVTAKLGLAAFIGVLLIAPVAWKFLRVQHDEGFGRSLAEARLGSAAARAYVTAPPGNLLYGRSGILAPAADDSVQKPTEQMLFPGFALVALAAFGVWRARKEPASRALVVALLLVGLVGLVLSFGPDGFNTLYALAHRVVFGFQAIRAPARFGVLVLFALAGLAAMGVRAIAQTRPRLAAAALALVAVEYINAPIAYVEAPNLETRTGAWLRDAPEPGAVMYQPLEVSGPATTPFMVESLIHRRPIVNGYSGLRPAFYDGLTQTMTQFPSLETIKALDDLGVRFVVSRAPMTMAAELPIVERARFDDGVIYEIRWTDAASASLAAESAKAAPLPALGPVPFAVGETAVYSIVWSTGPVSIPAGTATFRVEPGKQGGRFQFSVSATTAKWVSRFFEADDRFESVVDDLLRPIVLNQRIREGSRSVDRHVTFDRRDQVVRLKQGDTAEIAVPAAPDSLDPISAIYYLRAVALPVDGTIRLPVNDWGRNVSVTVPPGQPEVIEVDGARVEAIRIAPSVAKRDSQPALYRLTMWLSRDARRIPLVMTVDGLAGVGSVRMELESFTPGSSRD